MNVTMEIALACDDGDSTCMYLWRLHMRMMMETASACGNGDVHECGDVDITCM